jgi:hypothetical protein
MGTLMREYVIDEIALLALAQSLARSACTALKSDLLAATFDEGSAAS